MKSFWLALASMTVAGISFWAPNVMLFPRMNSMSSFFTEITFACPLSLLAVYGAATWCRSRYQRTGAGPSFALFGLIGVWVFGPWLMALAGTLAGGPGFHRASDYTPFLWMSICPPLTLYFSSMQENVFGLILATILMPVCHWVFEKQHWFVSPALKRRFHLHHNHPVAD